MGIDLFGDNEKPTRPEGVFGRVHSIESFGAVDGPGIRYVLFLQGCPLRCLYCHNPDSQSFDKGEVRSSSELVADILSYRNFIREGGVTISGGEPLAQPDFVLDILRRCRKNGIHGALDTSGCIPLDRARPVIDAADMLLLDLKAFDRELCIRLTGMDNRNAVEILDYCEKVGKPVWIRHVVVPGYTLDFDQLEKLAEFLRPYRCVEKIELLPFHQMGEYKWQELNKEYQLRETPAPTPEEMARAESIFKAKGLPL